MLMPRWRPCASSMTSTFKPTKLELSTSKQCWHLLEFANRTNMQLHAAVEDMTSQLREQEGIARQKANDHSQLREQF